MKTFKFKATGMQHYQDTFRKLMEKNDDFNLSKTKLLEEYVEGDRIWQLTFPFSKIELISEPDNQYDPNAIAVYVDGEKAAYIKKDDCDKVHELITSADFAGVDGDISGGNYKTIVEDENGYHIEKETAPVSFSIRILIREDTNQPAELQNSGSETEKIVHDKNASQKKNSKVGCAVLAIGIFVFLASCSIMFGGDNSKDNKPEKKSTTTTTATTQQAATTEAVSQDSAYESYMALVKTTLDTSFPDCNEISRDGNNVIIKAWQDGVTIEAMAAKTNGGAMLDQWNSMKDNVEYMAQSAYDLLGTSGIKDGHVTVNLLNDQNKENVLLTFLDGVCIYDCVNDEQ